MSMQDMRKLSSVLRSIELIEEKTNTMHAQYTTEHDHLHSVPIDDSNIHLQLFFQHLEQLLQLDLKNRVSLLSNSNNKRNYWNFFSLALKESKGLYDTVLYALNSQEVKTSTGRGRLFLRFCLQNHRLGDVIQQAFMTPKIINQFYVDECFWSTPAYMNRIMQALYQLNDIQFDLLSYSQYQLDVCWPTTESIEIRPKTLSDAASRLRNSSVSSFISMNSMDSHSILSAALDLSSSIPITPSLLLNLESSMNDGSSAQSLSSVDEDPENTVTYWKEKCRQLEVRVQEAQPRPQICHDVEVQCSFEEVRPVDESTSKQLEHENEQLRVQIDVLKDEINTVNFQLSSISIQSSTTTDKIRDHERELITCQTLIKSKEALLSELQIRFDDQSATLQRIYDELAGQSKEQKQRLELLQLELEQAKEALESDRTSIAKERIERARVQDQLEASLAEKSLDFDEMKRRLIKAVREKAELFNSIHSYEIKLEEEQSRKWVADEDALNCTKCNTAFGWTVRKHHCRHCQKIFCYYCSNNWVTSAKTNSPQYRVCDACNDILLKESLMPSGIARSELFTSQATSPEDVDTRFEVRAERLSTTPDNPSTS